MAPPVTGTRRALATSLLVNLLDVVGGLAVALLTGSAVVFAQMAQGLADVAGAALLVVGERRARRPGDALHPLGHQRESFFWALLSALAMLVLGGGLSLQRGYEQLVRPEPLRDPWLAASLLGLATLTNGCAARRSAAELAGPGGSLRAALAEPRRPLVKTALLRDAVGTLAALLGLLAVLLSWAADLVLFDAVGALLVAVLMMLLALLVIGQTRALIAGRSIPADDVERVRRVVLATPGVVALNGLAAVYAGGREILVELDLDLADGLATADIEALLDELQRRVRDAVPETGAVRVDLNSLETGHRVLGGGRVGTGPGAAGSAPRRMAERDPRI